mgnify:CR=1 FL=1
MTRVSEAGNNRIVLGVHTRSTSWAATSPASTASPPQ